MRTLYYERNTSVAIDEPLQFRPARLIDVEDPAVWGKQVSLNRGPAIADADYSIVDNHTWAYDGPERAQAKAETAMLLAQARAQTDHLRVKNNRDVEKARRERLRLEKIAKTLEANAKRFRELWG